MKKQLTIALLLPVLLLSAQTPEELWLTSLEKFNEEDYIGVIEDLNKFNKIVPINSYAYFNLAAAKFNAGDHVGACADYSKSKILGYKNKNKYIDYKCSMDKQLKLLQKHFYNNVKLYPELGYRPSYTAKDTLRGALRHERTCFDVFHYNLTVRINPSKKTISGSNVIRFHVTDTTQSIQIDLFDNYTIDDIIWNEDTLEYTRQYDALFISFPKTLQPNQSEEIIITYNGKPARAKKPPWEGGFVWKKDKKGFKWAGVACEHLGASSWWPNKDHLSDRPDSMNINIEVPKKYTAVSNGVLKQTIDIENDYKRYEWLVSYPITNYNVTFYMGNYVNFTDTLQTTMGPILLNHYVFPYNLEKAKEYFKQALDVVEVYNKYFGDYPFRNDDFKLVESFYEGMEHQSAIAYGNDYGKGKNSDYLNTQFDYIIVHEAAHEWWGNSIGAGDMADIWIHEGFATYAEYIFIEEELGHEEYLKELHHKMPYIFNFWPMVQNRNVNENTFAGGDVYTKGAVMLHCLRCNINNDSLFFNLVSEFYNRHKYSIVNSDDFVNFVSKFTKEDYNPFFNKFLYDANLPELNYSYKRVGNDFVLTYKWDGVEDGFKMPFGIIVDNDRSIRLEGASSDKEIVLENTQTFNFINEFRGTENAPHNSFTYYRTKCRDY